MPRQLYCVVAEFAVTVEVGPGLLGISASEHHRQDLFYTVETCELPIWQNCHFQRVPRQPVIVILPEFDETNGQPKVIGGIVDIHMHIRNSIEIGFRNQ